MPSLNQALVELAIQDIPHICDTCAYYCNAGCDNNCDSCPHTPVCRSCRSYNNWLWRGLALLE